MRQTHPLHTQCFLSPSAGIALLHEQQHTARCVKGQGFQGFAVFPAISAWRPLLFLSIAKRRKEQPVKEKHILYRLFYFYHSFTIVRILVNTNKSPDSNNPLTNAIFL